MSGELPAPGLWKTAGAAPDCAAGVGDPAGSRDLPCSLASLIERPEARIGEGLQHSQGPRAACSRAPEIYLVL